MNLKLSTPFVIAFFALTFLMHEAHEIAHTAVGRLICGCWGIRDFNVWELCKNCEQQHPISIIASFTGPAFSFLMMWIGYILLSDKKTDEQKAIGFCLIFANLPFGRILTAVIGGGDEVSGIDTLLNNRVLAWALGLSIILAITFIPLLKAYQLIINRRKIGWFLLFFIVPTFIDVLVVLLGMNTLLQMGLLNTYWILGSPLLVTLWTVFVLGLFLLTKRNIYKLADK